MVVPKVSVPDISVPVALLGAFTVYIAWLLSLVVYRRYFHPLAKVPGPFLPAVTYLYSWYYNVIKDGTYYKRIREMHAEYGPVVRIGPDEVQLSDPENYDQIYTVGSKFYKEPRIYGTLGSEMLFTAISNETHRQMRAPLNHFFSRRAVLDLEDIVQAKAKKLCDWVARDLAVETRPGGERASVNLRAGTRAMAIDVLTEYAFNDCWNHLDKPDFASWWSDAVRGTGIMWMTFQQFPALVKPMQALPESLSRKMSPAMDGWIDCVVRSRTHLYQVCDQFRKGIKPSRRSIFHELLDPPAPDPKDVAAGLANANPPAPPSRERLEGEALALTTAGSDSTGNVMETAVFHVIRQPGLYAAVRKELLDAFPNLPPDTDQNLDYATLEKLPLLSAVLKEGLRLSYGVTGRLARVVPKGGATFNGFYIPEGYTVSMTSMMKHRDSAIFPDPDKFDPARWIAKTPAETAAVRAREKCLVPFSRGSRSCIGQNLAMCEVYVFLGTFFRRFGQLEAYDVEPEDMELSDYFTPFHRAGSRPFKVAVKKE